MAIPKPKRPEYTITVPSTGKRIKYQPFTVKEEKVLVLAAESEDTDVIGNAIANVLSNCVTTDGFDPQSLALFDIEYLFLRARAKSVGESIQIRVTDPNDETCTLDHDIDIDSIKVEKNKEHTDLIQIDEETSVKMKYPDLGFFAEGIKIDTIQQSTETVALCISQICMGDEVYNRQDSTNEELVEWLDGLTADQFKKIMSFFETMPKLRHTIKKKNPRTGETFTVVLEGLADFF